MGSPGFEDYHEEGGGKESKNGTQNKTQQGNCREEGQPSLGELAQNLQVVKAENLVETESGKRCDLWLQGKGMGIGFPSPMLFSVM